MPDGQRIARAGEIRGTRGHDSHRAKRFGLVGSLRHPTSVEYLYNEGPRGILGLGRLNLGDLLCSPQTYLDLDSDHRTLIIGGGIQSAYVTGKKHPPEGYDKVCVWGGGLSSRPQQRLPKQIPGIDIWTIRDKDCVPDQENWLPCVSCLHPMLDHPALTRIRGRKLLYVNADPVIYSPAALLRSRQMARERGFDFCTNRADVHDFFRKWHDCEHVVTNSYHGAYWSLLAGKSVAIFGYNYKFYSLASMFGLSTRPIMFSKLDRKALIESTRAALDAAEPESLNNPGEKLEDFRARQMRFGQALCGAGVLRSLRPKPAGVARGSIMGKKELNRLLVEYAGRADSRITAQMRAVRRQAPGLTLR